jgi:predicted ATPase
VLSPSGNNLAAVLDALMTGPDRAAVTAMEAALHSAIPTLRGVSTPSAPDGQPGEKTIAFVLANDARPPVTIPCELASDGAMLLTAFLTLAYSDTPDVLLIEEPENGLHPSMLASVLALLRDMSTGKVGNRPRQIILTSHSPLLLNYATPEEIRIVRRDDKGTHVTPMTSVDVIADLMKEFGLGELWYLVGEQGLVEGKKP